MCVCSGARLCVKCEDIIGLILRRPEMCLFTDTARTDQEGYLLAALKLQHTVSDVAPPPPIQTSWRLQGQSLGPHQTVEWPASQ